ncbi:MAG: hypothetical protein ACKVOP_04780 [Sphingomonadaceae bacterium]
MKPLILMPLLLLTGLGIGGASAYAVAVLLPARPAETPHTPPVVETAFTPTGKILAPLVFPDGRLSGYVNFEVQLETAEADVGFVTLRLPLLLNAINMRTFRAPLASGPDGALPKLDVFRILVSEAATEAFGPRIVRRVVVTQAVPA